MARKIIDAMEKEKNSKLPVSLEDVDRELGAAFAERLRKIREERDLSQQALASGAGVSVTTIQNYEKGQYPKSEHAISLSRFLCCSLDWLLTGKEGIHKGRAFCHLDEAKTIDDRMIGIRNESYKDRYGYNFNAEKTVESLKKANSLLYYEMLKFEVMSSLSSNNFNYKYTCNLYDELRAHTLAKKDNSLISILGHVIESRKQ